MGNVKCLLTEKIQGNPEAARMKLIHAGKVLSSDATTMEAAGVKQGDYMVVMVAPKASPAVGPKTEEPARPASVSVSNPAETSSSSSPSGGVADMLSGEAYETAVANIVAMGFPRDQVQAAMRQSFNNPDRAVDLLMNPSAVLREGDEGTGEEGEDETNPLAFLRRDPNFLQLRRAIQQDPTMLPPLLEQIGSSNPELLQTIERNRDAFIELMNEQEEDDEEGGDDNEVEQQISAPSLRSHRIEITEEERASIEKLEQLGFDRQRVIEAYFACDKNEEVAANFLFEHANDEDAENARQ